MFPHIEQQYSKIALIKVWDSSFLSDRFRYFVALLRRLTLDFNLVHAKQLFVDDLFDFSTSQQKFEQWVCAIKRLLLGSNKQLFGLLCIWNHPVQREPAIHFIVTSLKSMLGMQKIGRLELVIHIVVSSA